jgi:ribosomal protein S18 acetylase RimI-like enzyme
MEPLIRLLVEADASQFYHLRREALLDSPLSFAASPEDDFASSEEAVRKLLTRDPEAVVFGAFAAELLVGTVGVYRARELKARHKAFLWGMFVHPQWRRRKLGEQLVRAAVGHARTLAGVTHIHLCVSEPATAARRLYESAGFRVWGVEPEAIRWQGRSVADCHMVLTLARE